MIKTLIDKPREYEAEIGEVLEMHFSVVKIGFLARWQKERIKAHLEKDPHLEVLKIEEYPGTVIVTVKIVSNPFPIVLAIAAVIVVVGGFFAWASLDTVYKITHEAPEEGAPGFGLFTPTFWKSVTAGIVVIVVFGIVKGITGR